VTLCLKSVAGICCAIALHLPSQAHAGVSVEAMDQDPSTGGAQRTIVVTLSGRVDEQMAQEFETKLRPHLHPVYTNYETRGNIVVRLLDSDGGFINDGLRIAKTIREEYITTFVPKGSRCKSACAVIFLAGRRSSYGMTPWLERILEVGATVGFHGPYDPAGASGPNGVTVGISISRRILETLGDALPLSLFNETITLPAGTTKNIDSVYDALRWDIELKGYRRPNPGRESLLNACINFFHWRHKRPIGAIEGINMDEQEPKFLEDKNQNQILDEGGNGIKANNYVLPGEEDEMVRDIRENERAPDFLRDLRHGDGSYASQFAFSHGDESMAFWCSATYKVTFEQILIFPQRLSVNDVLKNSSGVVSGRAHFVPEWFAYPAGTMLSDISE